MDRPLLQRLPFRVDNVPRPSGLSLGLRANHTFLFWPPSQKRQLVCLLPRNCGSENRCIVARQLKSPPSHKLLALLPTHSRTHGPSAFLRRPQHPSATLPALTHPIPPNRPTRHPQNPLNQLLFSLSHSPPPTPPRQSSNRNPSYKLPHANPPLPLPPFVFRLRHSVCVLRFN